MIDRKQGILVYLNETKSIEKGYDMLFPFLAVFIVLALFLAYRYRLGNKQQQAETDSFWERERRADATLAKDISHLEYLSVPLEQFPIGQNRDEAICALEDRIQNDACLPMLNLTNMSNTDLKEAYGVPNLSHMQEVGENYNRFSILLKDYAAALIALGQYQNALPVLEYAAGTKSDISQIYKMLGDCYANCHQAHKIPYLMDQVRGMHLILESSILSHLQNRYDAADTPNEDFSAGVQDSSV